MNTNRPYDGRLSRRQVMRLGMAGAGVMLSWRMGLGATNLTPTAQVSGSTKGNAKSVIQIWLNGGPPHLDTFDPKPEAGRDYCGQFDKPIATNIDGIRICELLPLLAKHADKYSLIRGMTHGINAHETAAYMEQTGRQPGEGLVYPTIGAVVSLLRGYDAGYHGLIPPFVVLTQPEGRFSETGFLNSKYKPFATGGDPSQPRFAVEGIVAQGLTEERQQNRRTLLHQLDSLNHALESDGRLSNWDDGEKGAYDLILGDGGKIFDLSSEKDELRQSYGVKSAFGQSCLMARRLVERGVPYISINNGGWDTHKQNFEAMRRKLPEVDAGLSTLLTDLSDRGLLASTVIWCGGEFGRTPKIQWESPWNGGRGHWGNAFSVLVAGGGFKGGHVVGETDSRGETVKNRPVHPIDLIGSIYELMGFDLDAKLPHPQGLTARLLPGPGDNVKSAGRLKEIM